jgi:hypothetical protein
LLLHTARIDTDFTGEDAACASDFADKKSQLPAPRRLARFVNLETVLTSSPYPSMDESGGFSATQALV